MSIAAGSASTTSPAAVRLQEQGAQENASRNPSFVGDPKTSHDPASLTLIVGRRTSSSLAANVARTTSFISTAVNTTVRGASHTTGSDQSCSEIVTDFTKRSLELTIISRRLSSGLDVDPTSIAIFSLELMNFHAAKAPDLMKHFKTSLVHGLTTARAKDQLAILGPNVLPPPNELPLWAKFILCFFSGFNPLLWIAAFFVFLSWEPFGTPPSNVYNLALAIVLLVVIFLSSMFNFYQEVQTNQVLSTFTKLLPPACIVTRDAQVVQVSATELVPGDIVELTFGTRVPADCRVLRSSNLKIDKSLLNGENEPVRLFEAPVTDPEVVVLQSSNMAFMGCNIVEGTGTGLVVATNKDTQLAKIAKEVGGVAQKTTGLQIEINNFVFIIACFSVVTATICILVWALYLNTQHNGFMTSGSMIANAISVLVAYVPEGLPLSLSMGLTLVARRLGIVYHVMVKQLSIVETVGSMSLLASDKTGTLTQNKMTVRRVIVPSAILVADGCVPVDLDAGSIDVLLATCAHCNQAKLEAPQDNEDGSKGSGVPVAVGGNGIDQAILNWAAIAAPSSLEKVYRDYAVKVMMPFSSKVKLAAVVVQKIGSGVVVEEDDEGNAPPARTNTTRVIVKGAPEFVIARCASYVDVAGAVAPLTVVQMADLNKNIDQVSNEGQRVIAIAYADLQSDRFPEGFAYEAEPEPNFPLVDLTFLTCIVVSDPPRVGVREAVETMRGAGIRVAMVTGDATKTAVAIAKQVGIVSAEGAAPDSLAQFLDAPRRTEGVVLKPDADDALSLSEGRRGKEAEAVDLESQMKMLRTLSSTGVVIGRSTKSTAVVIEGRDLDAITKDGWDFVFAHTEMVFARTTPEHKLMIVKESQSRGHRVGVTGDGVNDSPALKAADVGIAMYAGSDVAKDAAAIVLLKDDFASIVECVCQGRLIFVNLRKAIGYQLSAGSWSECVPVLATFFFGMAQPLSSFLMIIISCMTDVYAGIALMREPPEKAIMLDQPRDLKKQPLVNSGLIFYYLFYGTLESVSAFYLYFLYMAERGPTHSVPSPVPADDDGSRTFPAGYRSSQLLHAWNWGTASLTSPLGIDEANAANTASSVFFVALIVSQWGHLTSIRRKTPYFSDSILGHAYTADNANVFVRMWRELLDSPPRISIVAAIIASAATAVLFTEAPAIQVACGTGSVDPRYWGMAIGWSVLWFLVAEIRKWIILLFPNSQFVRMIAW